MLELRQLKKEPLSGQTKCIVINLTILEQRVIVALLILQKGFLLDISEFTLKL